MPEPTLPLPSDDPADDLPRTFRRERDAQAREAREREEAARARSQGSGDAAEPMPPAATVTHIDIPFVRLMIFFLKAAAAAVPALILLGVILLLAGKILTPLVHIQIDIPPRTDIAR